MKTTFIFLTTLFFSSVFAQDHSGSDVADRIPAAYHYKGDNTELHIIASYATISGYFIKDGQVDSIRFGSLLKNDVAVYLKSGDLIQGKTKSFDELKLKIVDDNYKKKGTVELKLANQDKIKNFKATDQGKYTQESGLGIYMKDADHIEFAVFWEERKNLNSNTEGVFKSYDGVAVKTSGSIYKYEEYKDEESPQLNTNVFIEIKDGKAYLWIDSEMSSMLGGLKKNEKISFSK